MRKIFLNLVTYDTFSPSIRVKGFNTKGRRRNLWMISR
nr:MAG TPA: hypothetical protein [Caudoviricetes sp.]